MYLTKLQVFSYTDTMRVDEVSFIHILNKGKELSTTCNFQVSIKKKTNK